MLAFHVSYMHTLLMVMLLRMPLAWRRTRGAVMTAIIGLGPNSGTSVNEASFLLVHILWFVGTLETGLLVLSVCGRRSNAAPLLRCRTPCTLNLGAILALR